MLDLNDIRKLAIHVQCRTESRRSAAEDFKARLSALISRAPRIKFWN